MFGRLLLFGALATWCVVHGITVPVDRADVHLGPTRPSMIDNGWRPLTGYESIPSSGIERKPLRGESLQEHRVVPEKAKTKSSKPQEYSPPTILGSFSIFGHAAAKARDKPKTHPKQSASATTRYTFLVPPPRDSFRFESDHQRKPLITRENEGFTRQPGFSSPPHHSEALQSSGFFSKGAPFASSTTLTPTFAKNRPFLVNGINGFAVQPPPHRHNPPSQFEVQKASNTKLYFQPPNVPGSSDFGKNKAAAESFERYQAQSHTPQGLNNGAGNFYSQVDHPPPYNKNTYERDPSYLVHESHEVSYVTPSSSYRFNFRPAVTFDGLVRPGVFSSTPSPPKIEPSKFVTPQQSSIRNEPFKQFELNNKPVETLIKNAGTYYFADEQRPAAPQSSWPRQKSKFTTEINEVLPRKNPPAKFRQENVRPSSGFGLPSPVTNQAEVIYIRPNVQTQFENPVQAVTVQQSTSTEPEYETPESISLKHFNEQQFLIQQQLVQQDRQRLREQELQRQRDEQRVRDEELRKQEEELRLIEQQAKEAERARAEELIKQQKLEEERRQQAQEEYELRRHQEMQEQIEKRKQQEARERQELEERHKQQEAQEQQERIELRKQSVTREQLEKRKQQQAEELERRRQQQLRERLEEQKKLLEQQEYDRPATHTPTFTRESYEQYQEAVEVSTESPSLQTQEEAEPGVRPYKPKFPQRGSYRRRGPTTTTYEAQQATQPPMIQEVTTFIATTDAPNTVQPEATTIPATTRPRIRRPGQPLKRRRPSATTLTPDLSSPDDAEQSAKYQSSTSVPATRRRPRPTQSTTAADETATERRYIRRRPSGHRHRVNPGEPFEAEVVTEIVKPTRVIYKTTTEWENYPESFKKKDSQELDTSFPPTTSLPVQEQATTQYPHIYEYSTEAQVAEEIPSVVEQPFSSERITSSREEDRSTPLEQLFAQPEENHVEPGTTIKAIIPTTTMETTTTTTTTTTTQPPVPTPAEVVSSTRPSHRIRPLKYGNATRPRFSIKDYKSRLDYKNRLAQISTTDSTPVSTPGRRRFQTTERSDDNSEAPSRENNGRYKYMSRPTYRTSTSTAPTLRHEENDEEPTTVRINRFVPKRKLNANRYRSRTTTTTQSTRLEQDASSRQSLTRAENLYSSPIRRSRPSPRPRIQPEPTPTTDTPEMAAAETSFYSPMSPSNAQSKQPEDLPTSSPIVVHVDEESVGKESANEVARIEESSSPKDSDEVVVSPELSNTEAAPTEEMEDQSDAEAPKETESIPTIVVTTTEAVSDTEDDFLISQRIASLTSSASQLHEPGMFKAVSPATESRVISPLFAMATEEPTLPIEAFFQVLSKKEE